MSVAKKPVTAPSGRRTAVALGDRRSSLSIWQDRIRDPSLTVLLALELCAIFLAAPLAAKGLPVARAVADTLVLAVLVIVVLLSKKWGYFLGTGGIGCQRRELSTERGLVANLDCGISSWR